MKENLFRTSFMEYLLFMIKVTTLTILSIFVLAHLYEILILKEEGINLNQIIYIFLTLFIYSINEYFVHKHNEKYNKNLRVLSKSKLNILFLVSFSGLIGLILLKNTIFSLIYIVITTLERII